MVAPGGKLPSLFLLAVGVYSAVVAAIILWSGTLTAAATVRAIGGAFMIAGIAGGVNYLLARIRR